MKKSLKTLEDLKEELLYIYDKMDNIYDKLANEIRKEIIEKEKDKSETIDELKKLFNKLSKKKISKYIKRKYPMLLRPFIKIEIVSKYIVEEPQIILIGYIINDENWNIFYYELNKIELEEMLL